MFFLSRTHLFAFQNLLVAVTEQEENKVNSGELLDRKSTGHERSVKGNLEQQTC